MMDCHTQIIQIEDSTATDSVIVQPGNFQNNANDKTSLDNGPTGTAGSKTETSTEWIYRAEGNRSLVIANLKDRIVYRLLKRSKKNANDKAEYDELREKLLKGIEFAKHVMTPLIGHHLAKPGRLVELHNGFMSHIHQQVNQLRPDYRQDMEIDVDCPFAVGLPDHCLMPVQTSPSPHPTFGIEIKPKCGFMPELVNLGAGSHIKTHVCRFCLHQYLKVEAGKWSKRTDYCPINLFSGNHSRMSKALKSLFKDPQNNLRIFKDGVPVFGDGAVHKDLDIFLNHFVNGQNNTDKRSTGKALDQLIEVMKECLLYEPGGLGERYEEQVCLRGGDEGEGGQGLPRHCVLGRVLQTQRLDNLDIEKVHPLYLRVKNHLQCHPADRRNWNLDGPFHDTSCWRLENPSPFIQDDASVEFAVKKIREFHASRTAKDCSIMLAIQQQDNSAVDSADDQGSYQITTSNGISYRFTVAVIDLDPKPWDKIQRYLDEDMVIVDYHNRFPLSEYSRSLSSDILVPQADGSSRLMSQ